MLSFKDAPATKPQTSPSIINRLSGAMKSGVPQQIFVGVVASLAVLSSLPIPLDKFELLTHFLPFYVTVLACTMAVMVMQKKWLAAGLIAICTLPSLWTYREYFSPVEKPVQQADSRLKILQLNLFPFRNNDYQATLNSIRLNNPDIISTAELSRDWRFVLNRELRHEYPYSIAISSGGPGDGIGVFSKIPLRNARIKHSSISKRPHITAKIFVGTEEVTFISIHPPSPVRHLKNRDVELVDIADDIQDLGTKQVIVSGDFNCTQWSPAFRTFIRTTGLQDTEKGFGFQPTWPAPTVLGKRLRVPLVSIDHVLVSDDLITYNRKVLRSVGSDHLPVLVDIGLDKASIASKQPGQTL